MKLLSRSVALTLLLGLAACGSDYYTDPGPNAFPQDGMTENGRAYGWNGQRLGEQIAVCASTAAVGSTPDSSDVAVNSRFCQCMIDAASRRWDYYTYAPSADAYLGTLFSDGTYQACYNRALGGR